MIGSNPTEAATPGVVRNSSLPRPESSRADILPAMRTLGFVASRLSFALSTLVLGPSLVAQGWLPAPRVNLSRTAGLHLLDGVLCGVGDGYRVRFEAEGFEFTPVLEPAAAEAHAMAFRLESIGREGQTMAPSLGGVTPQFDGLRVEYDRGVAIERYDISVDGLEQSFVFRERPRGTGDLVVRGRVRTDLQVTPAGAGLRLERPGVGSFTIGGVVGIDAAGERCDGRVRFVDGALELSLPAEFVERAALPLTLDPFIGNVVRVATTALDFRPRVSFDVTTDSYLVVWQSSNSVHAHRVSRTGALVGTRLVVETVGRVPEVANVNDRDAFVIVYERSGNIFGRIVSAASTVSTEATIASTADSELTPTVGGSQGFSATNPGAAVCAWVSPHQGTVSIQAVALNIDPTRRPVMVVGPIQTPAIGFTSLPAAPRLSRSDGGVGRYALAYHRDGLVDAVMVVALDRTGSAITSELQMNPSSVRDGQFADVDGDGSNWVVAWTERNAFSALIVAARGVAWSASQRILVPTAGTGMGTGLENTGPSASVTWIGDSHLLGAVSTTRVDVQSIDPFLCGPCEGILPVTGVGTAGSTPFGCGTIAGSGPADEALVAGSDANGVFARPFRAVDGVVTSLGGGCGSGGTALVTCARSPNSRFAHRLRNSIPNSPCAFVLSGSQGQFSCGTCTVIPDLAAAIVLTNSVGAGDSSLPVAIPTNSSLRGVPLFEQWATLNLLTPACGLFSLDLSNALRVVIE